MHKNQVGKISACGLSDKDIQLLRKTYLKLTELYYENPKNESITSDIINIGHLITQTIQQKRESDVLSLIPITESLKVKSKSRPDILEHIEQTVNHLRFPTQNQIKYETLLHSLQTSDLFSVGCTVGIRFYQKIQVNGSDFNWKQIIEQLSRNVSINPNLCIELSFLICRESEIYSRCAVKSGLIKYVFLSYIGSTLENKFLLYKAIKLLKIVADADGTLLREKQKSLSLVIYTYEDYVPVVEGIVSKCYDSDYSQGINQDIKRDPNMLDQAYLWSYLELFCVNNLSEQTVNELIKRLKGGLGQEKQTKTYAILANYSKYKKKTVREVLQIVPKSEKSLLNFIKFCVNCCQTDFSSSTVINMGKLEELVEKSPNQKVSNLFKYLKQLNNQESKIGHLSQNYKKMFDMQKNADFMLQRAAKIPQNNEQLTDIKQILKEKDRNNEFESDTLKTVKEKALNSLNIAIIEKKKLDLNILLREVDLGDVRILAQLLQILELCLTINDELVETIDVKRVLEIIEWIEENYNGELIEWSSISQLLMILTEEDEWKNHLKEIPNKCFWLLNIQILTEEDEELIEKRLVQIEKEIGKYHHKIPFFIGFIGRSLMADSKLRLFHSFPTIFTIICQNIKNNSAQAYKTSLVMYSAFIKGWSVDCQEEEDLKSSKIFEKQIIEPMSKIVLNNFRSLDQEYQFLENCLPYEINNDLLRDNIDYLISFYGSLASYIYKQSQKQGLKPSLSYERIKAITTLPFQKSRNIFNILTFLQENSELLQGEELNIVLDNMINKKLAYWFLYPNFYNIVSKILSIFSKTQNSVLKSNVTHILCKLISYIIANEDLQEVQKEDLFSQIKKCLGNLAAKNQPIDKQKITKVVLNIQNQEIKEEILQILNNYKIIIPLETESQAKPQQSHKPASHASELSSNVLGADADLMSQIQDYSPSNENKSKEEECPQVNIDKLDLCSGESESELRLIDALRLLKKIIEKKEPQQRFPSLCNAFMKNQVRVEYKDILGHLLAMFYPQRPVQMKKQALQLLQNSQKTRLSKESCFQLLKENAETFCLSRRWKLTGREWLDLAMLRFSEGQVSDACQVAEQNISSTSELQYFLSKGYHELVVRTYPLVQNQQDFVYILLLVGTSARNNNIKYVYFKERMHIKTLSLVNKYKENTKLFANLLYALSSMVYMQPEVCLDLIKQKHFLQIVFNCLKRESENKLIVQSGACLVANLSYSSEEVKEVLRHLNVIEIFLFLFESVIPLGQLTTFKQILRAFGNLSLSLKCTQELIDQHFCSLAVRMIEKIDSMMSVDQNKAVLKKLLVDLVANLASHRYRLEVFHREKLTHILLTLLETTRNNIPLLTACIDTIDCLCQCTQIQNYVVTQKKIGYILTDILKIQTDDKIVVKSIRLLTNLTINSACIPHILKASLLSVLANTVMPHFYESKTGGQQNKKMQTYILKIIGRIYHSKIDKQILLKSGYLDCLIRTIENTESIGDVCIDILYYFSQIMPNYLNKRAFICLVKILTKKIEIKEIVIKCLRAIKKLSSFYEKAEEDFLVPGTAQMYQKLLTSEFKDQGLELLSYHLFRSDKLRLFMRSKESKTLDLVKKIGENNNYVEFWRQIVFLIQNPFILFEETDEIAQEGQYQQLKKGFKCKLFRIDGSSKKAVVDMNDEFEIRAYKFPDGEIKKKYVVDIKNIKEFQFNYPSSEELWNSTVFSIEKGLFDIKKCDPKSCGTLMSSRKWGEISFMNVEFESEAEKLRFYVCLRSVYNSLR